MATWRNKGNLAAASRETPENTRNNQPQNTFNPRMAQEYITQVCEEIEGRVTRKLSQEFSRTKSRILGAFLSSINFFLNPQVRTCSVAVRGTYRNYNSESREPTEDRSLKDPCFEVVFSACHTNNLIDSDHEKTYHKS